MEKQTRAEIIISNILSLDERWSRVGRPRENRSQPTEIVSDSHVWNARISRGDQKGPNGKLWDLLELTVYDELRLVAIFSASEVEVRIFNPGEWERIFGTFNPLDRTRILPN